MSRPSNSMLPPSMSTRRSSERPVVDLPQPDSPTSASVSPACEVEADLLDRVHAPRARGRRFRLARRSAWSGRAPAAAVRGRRRRRVDGSRVGATWRRRCLPPAACERARAASVPAHRAQPRHRGEQRSACTDARGACEDLRRGAVLDLLAAVHHHDAVGHLGDDAHVVRDEDTAMCISSCRARISSRICAWIVTSSAVVGSSAISSAGLARQRHRDHHSLAHAAGELVRIARQHAGGFRDAHLHQHAQRLGGARRRSPCPGAAGSTRRSARRP